MTIALLAIAASFVVCLLKGAPGAALTSEIRERGRQLVRARPVLLSPPTVRQGLGPVACLAVALVLAGCAPTQLPPGMADRVHTVGFISALGDQIRFARSGITIFGNDRSEGDVADWRIDDLVMASAKSSLEPRYQVTARKGDPEKLFGTTGMLNPLLAGEIRPLWNPI